VESIKSAAKLRTQNQIKFKIPSAIFRLYESSYKGDTFQPSTINLICTTRLVKGAVSKTLLTLQETSTKSVNTPSV